MSAKPDQPTPTPRFHAKSVAFSNATHGPKGEFVKNRGAWVEGIRTAGKHGSGVGAVGRVG